MNGSSGLSTPSLILNSTGHHLRDSSMALKRLDAKTSSSHNANMNTRTKRTTVYFDSGLYRAIRLKSANTNRSVSDIVNESLRESLREDQEDLAAFDERADEPNISYEDFLAKLKADGKI